MDKKQNLNNQQNQQLNIVDVREYALDWWNKLPMYNMDKTCKRTLAARYYQTERSFLTNEQIEFIFKQEQLSITPDVMEGFSDEVLIELAKNNCIMHQTSDDLGFLVMFDLNTLRQFCIEHLKVNELRLIK